MSAASMSIGSHEDMRIKKYDGHIVKDQTLAMKYYDETRIRIIVEARDGVKN